MKYSALSVTGRVTPLMVRSPAALLTLSPSNAKLPDLKVICGNFAELKKSSLRRCSSSLGWPVLTDPVSMAMSALPDLAAVSRVTFPEVLLKRPRWKE